MYELLLVINIFWFCPFPLDMYSFDVSEELAKVAYRDMCGAYERIFKRLDLPVQKGTD